MFYICSMTDAQLVWFKRDLRAADHAALTAACATGDPVLPLYIFEPDYWSLPEHSGRQFEFLLECLHDLDEALKARGSGLVIRVGQAAHVFAALHKTCGVAAIHAHEETGLQWTFDRDKTVRDWALRAGVPVREHRQHGVIRGLKQRDGWDRKWEALMSAPRLAPPDAIPASNVPGDPWPTADDLGLAADPCPGRQPGGRRAAIEMLKSFLSDRGRTYRTSMSSPQSAFETCSRLSPHLAFGTLSIRETYQSVISAREKKRAVRDETFTASIDSFISRLHWHCHFIQKLESQTSIESRNLHSAYDGLRDNPAADDPRFVAWATGQTGLPFVDACMRSLHETGWLNFRMRAMLMSFASYHLWMHWKRPAEHLAALFTDFEPGIHFAQAQMQSGTTGINIPRIYNPVKQSRDQDVDGAFIRRWVPELARLGADHIHAPWEAPEDVLQAAGIKLGERYPHPVVDHIEAARAARAKIHARRGDQTYRQEANAIQDRHGSRKSGIRHRGVRPKARHRGVKAPEQLTLDFAGRPDQISAPS